MVACVVVLYNTSTATSSWIKWSSLQVLIKGACRITKLRFIYVIEVLRMGIFSGYFRLAAAMFEGSNVQWRLGKIAFHIADKLRRQLTRQG